MEFRTLSYVSGNIRTIKPKHVALREPRIEQLVQRLATGSTAEASELESRQGQDFSPLNVVQAGSGAHPAGGSVPGGKAAEA
jgi:hypothetical protein